MEDKTTFTHGFSNAPQIHVRTGIRSGNVLDKCQQEVADLEKHYQQLRAEARQRGITV